MGDLQERPATQEAGNEPYGALLRRYRKAAGKTMGDLARHMGIPVWWVSDVERGQCRPWSWSRRIQAAAFLSLTPEQERKLEEADHG